MRTLLVLVALSLSGCIIVQDPNVGPVRAFDARPFIPEGWYQDEFRRMEKCTGRDRSYTDVEWYVAPANSMVNERGEIAAGIWSSPNRVYLDSRFILNAMVIRHELAHYLMQLGDIAHADPLFEMCTSV